MCQLLVFGLIPMRVRMFARQQSSRIKTLSSAVGREFKNEQTTDQRVGALQTHHVAQECRSASPARPTPAQFSSVRPKSRRLGSLEKPAAGQPARLRAPPSRETGERRRILEMRLIFECHLREHEHAAAVSSDLRQMDCQIHCQIHCRHRCPQVRSFEWLSDRDCWPSSWAIGRPPHPLADEPSADC